MPDDDMTIETAELPLNAGENVEQLHEQNMFRRHLNEVLRPSSEIVHQAGLGLINTRLWLENLSKKYDNPITVDTVPDDEWHELFARYESIWFMGIYKPSDASSEHARKYAYEFKSLLQDFDPVQDVVSSPYSIPEYSPNPRIAADWEAWDKMVNKLHANNKKVIVDFVPNHMAVDHAWAFEHPEYFIQGSEYDFNANPAMYVASEAADGNKYYLAHGKDPNYPEWADTLQLNYAKPEVQEEMEKVLLSLVDHADGVRCDMAMLMNPNTFERTWGHKLSDDEKKYIWENRFWEKVIPKAKAKAQTLGRDFSFIAEAYWDKEDLGQHFDYIYGKEFYDHVKRIIVNHETPGQAFKEHIRYLMTAAKSGRHFREVLFTENHDEGRAVREFGKKQSEAAASLIALIPESIFLLNQGQDEGRTIRPPMQIRRFPDEPIDSEVKAFYDHLLTLKHSILFQQGDWNLADIDTFNEDIIALKVSMEHNQKEIMATICINLGEETASARIPAVGKSQKVEVYRLNEGNYVTNPDQERNEGLYVELKPWETQVVFSQSR